MSNQTETTTSVVRTDKEYEYWRWRILLGTMIGYIFFYFVRKSITMAMPGLEGIGVTKTTLGLFLTIHGVLYGVARFVNGVWSDRVNPRYFMSIGLFLAAMTNVFCGFSENLASALFPSKDHATMVAWIIGSFWIINGWVQGMGFPPCAKSLMHWFAPHEHGIKFATWNISHSFGAGLVFLLNSFVVALGWKYCFLVPAALSLSGAVFLFWALRDSPEKEGFEPVEKYYERTRGTKTEPKEAVAEEAKADVAETAESEEPEAGWWQDLCKNVFSNWAVWVLCFANFFVYIVRFSILDWAPTFLSQSKGLDLQSAGWATACYEVFGAFGIILSGVMMDKVFNGRGAKACFVYMLGCGLASFAFWKLDSDSLILNILLLSFIGFFIYGPQCLIGCVASTIATKKSGAASSGLTGLFGYLATIVTGFGVGFIVDGATRQPKIERDIAVATVVAQLNPDVDSGRVRDSKAFPDLVKSAEKYADATKAASRVSKDELRVIEAKLGGIEANVKIDVDRINNILGEDEKNLKKSELIAKKYEARNALSGNVLKVLGANANDAVAEEHLNEIADVAIQGRADISKAGWPRIFGMLVVSSLAALILFALIFNAASPEVLREEARRREEAAKAKA